MPTSLNGFEQPTGMREKEELEISMEQKFIHFQIQKYGTKVYIFKFRDARKTEDKTFVAAPFQPVEPGTEWER